MRLQNALEAWETERKNLETAVARAEAKEREFREVSGDVRRRLEALLLTASMANEVEGEIRFERSLPETPRYPMLSMPTGDAAMEKQFANRFKAPEPEPETVDVLLGTSSRPLFTAAQRARAGELSILP